MYNYMPRNEDELELKEGDVVDVMEKCDDGWFVGKKREFWVFYSKDIRVDVRFKHAVEDLIEAVQ